MTIQLANSNYGQPVKHQAYCKAHYRHHDGRKASIVVLSHCGSLQSMKKHLETKRETVFS